MKVHPECRRLYTNSLQIYLHLQKKHSSDSSTNKRTTKQSEDPFNNQTDCLFCGTNVHEGSADYSYVKTDNFAKSILQSCDKRNDEWSLKVKCRIEYYRSDLHAADCVYHNACSTHFRCDRDVPTQFQPDCQPKRRKAGRPKNEDQEQAFSKMCAYFE